MGKGKGKWKSTVWVWSSWKLIFFIVLTWACLIYLPKQNKWINQEDVLFVEIELSLFKKLICVHWDTTEGNLVWQFLGFDNF